MTHAEAEPTPPEFVVSPGGLGRAVEVAAQKLIEAERYDASAAAALPTQLGNLTRAYAMDQASILRQQADLIASTLEMAVLRPDDMTWDEAIKADQPAS